MVILNIAIIEEEPQEIYKANLNINKESTKKPVSQPSWMQNKPGKSIRLERSTFKNSMTNGEMIDLITSELKKSVITSSTLNQYDVRLETMIGSLPVSRKADQHINRATKIRLSK